MRLAWWWLWLLAVCLWAVLFFPYEPEVDFEVSIGALWTRVDSLERWVEELDARCE